jgi:hypothetical protein
MATCGLCSRKRKLPHVGFLAVSAGDLEVAIVTKAPKKFSDIYIYVEYIVGASESALLFTTTTPSGGWLKHLQGQRPAERA